jgi:hypothetical protein
MRHQMEERLCLNAQQTDDPWLLFFTNTLGSYASSIILQSATNYIVFATLPIGRASTKNRYANWEATLELIHLDPSPGLFYVADEDVVLGPKGVRLTKAKVLLGYILAQYIDGDDAERGANSYRVRRFIYRERYALCMDKLKAYFFKLQQRAGKSRDNMQKE